MTAQGTLRRATSLGPPERFLLDCWARSLRVAFGWPPLLVGSVARGEAWRDVDVRLVLPPEDFTALAGGDPRRIQALNVAVSLWGQKATGLPIDFQFQGRDEGWTGPSMSLGWHEEFDR